jgi:hypothetical protein
MNDGDPGRMKPGSLSMMKAFDVYKESKEVPFKINNKFTTNSDKHESTKAIIVAKDVLLSCHNSLTRCK